MMPVLASFPLLPSFVQEESNIRNIQMGKYIVKVLSEEPDVYQCAGRKSLDGLWIALSPSSIKMCSQLYLPHLPLH